MDSYEWSRLTWAEQGPLGITVGTGDGVRPPKVENERAKAALSVERERDDSGGSCCIWRGRIKN